MLFQIGEALHGLDLLQSVFHGWIAQVIEQLHAVNSQHRGQWIRRTSVLALGVITGDLLLQLLPRIQLAHPLQKYLALGIALRVLVLGLSEGNST